MHGVSDDIDLLDGRDCPLGDFKGNADAVPFERRNSAFDLDAILTYCKVRAPELLLNLVERRTIEYAALGKTFLLQ